MFTPEMMQAAQNMMANMSPEQMAQMTEMAKNMDPNVDREGRGVLQGSYVDDAEYDGRTGHAPWRGL